MTDSEINCWLQELALEQLLSRSVSGKKLLNFLIPVTFDDEVKSLKRMRAKISAKTLRLKPRLARLA